MTDDPIDSNRDASAEGARARVAGRPRDACPYAMDTPERDSWLEGYDGSPADHAADLPLDQS